MPKIVCKYRDSTEIDRGIQCLDDTKVQLLFTKFPVGSGTFKRSKYLYIKFIGSNCGVVRRGQGINEINSFASKEMHGFAGLSTTDKNTLSFETLVEQMKDVFVTDYGTFSLDQIKADYKKRLLEEHATKVKVEKAKRAQTEAKIERRRASIARLRRNSKIEMERRSARREASEQMKDLATYSQDKMDSLTRMLLDSLREPEGPITWISFEAQPDNPRVTAYGRNGIFEMVKNLPDDKWLFGLFRMSFNMNNVKERRIVLFQFIGSKLKTSTRSGVYPGMAKLLSPFDYEIYLIGQGDLDVQAIINKSKNAFSEVQTEKKQTITFTAEQYKKALVEEQSITNRIAFEPFQPARSPAVQDLPYGGSSATSSPGNSFANLDGFDEYYDVEETLKLIKQPSGGLVWGVFEVEF